MTQVIKEQILNNSKLCIVGFEGCGKSSMTLQAMLEVGQRFIFACNSFEQLKEKQQSLIKHQGLTEEECPIISNNLTDTNKNYLSSPNNPDYIPSTAKVVLCTHFYLTKNYHNYNSRTKGLPVIADEFRWEQVLIPSVGIQLLRASSSNTNIKKFISGRYSRNDAKRLLADLQLAENTGEIKSDSFTAEWLTTTEKLVFLTSEKLAETILKALGFNIFNIPNNQDLSGKYFKVAAADINSEWFERMGQNKIWHILANDYDLIITDKAKHNIIKNHTVVQGSNQHIDKSILVILSQLPKSAITYITATLNDVTKQNFSYEDIAALIYRDRLCQAIGRNLGNRGDGPTYVACNTTIWNTYLQPRYNSLSFPVNYTDWDKNTALEVIQSQSAKTINKASVQDHFEYHEGSYIPLKEIQNYIETNDLRRQTGAFIKVADILNTFSGVYRGKYGERKAQSQCLRNVRFKTND